MLICEHCGRPKATREEFESLSEEDLRVLCCGEWNQEQCDPGWFKRDPDKLYALDLRAMGLDISDSIPDCASVPRSSVRFGEPDFSRSASSEDKEQGIIRGEIPVEFTEPFEWMDVNVTFPEKEEP